MKDCTNCIHADWQRTSSGSLHPSGEGKCGKTIAIPQLPPCYYWLGGKPYLAGGFISRREELKEHCPFYQERLVRPSELL